MQIYNKFMKIKIPKKYTIMKEDLQNNKTIIRYWDKNKTILREKYFLDQNNNIIGIHWKYDKDGKLKSFSC